MEVDQIDQIETSSRKNFNVNTEISKKKFNLWEFYGIVYWYSLSKYFPTYDKILVLKIFIILFEFIYTY